LLWAGLFQVKACDPLTSPVANTAKRVIVMLYMAAVIGKALTHEQSVGAGVAIAGVFLYSVVDDVAKKNRKKLE
jgi:solute carrier family 35 protein E1